MNSSLLHYNKWKQRLSRNFTKCNAEIIKYETYKTAISLFSTVCMCGKLSQKIEKKIVSLPPSSV